ncbi:MAG: hypothetical protein ACYS5V_17020 [Planctomycetota bacterium]|jgi:hypothetical protein
MAADEQSEYGLREVARKAAQAVAPALAPTARDLAWALLGRDRAAYDIAVERLRSVDPALKTESQAVTAALEAITPKRIDRNLAGTRAMAILVKRLGHLGTDARGAVAMVRAAAYNPYEARELMAGVSIPPGAVPELLAIAKSQRYQSSQALTFARECLARVGAPAVPAVVALLNGDVYRTRFALRTLAGMGPDAAPALSKVMPLLDAQERSLRSSALEVLADMGPAAAPAAGKLLAILRSRRSRPGRAAALAARSLGNMGPAGRDAIPDLMDLLTDYRSPGAREEAVLALARLRPCIKAAGGPLMPQIGRDLMGLCKSAAPYPYCLEAIACLSELGPEAAFLEPELVALTAIGGDPFTSGHEKAYAAVRDAAKEALVRILGREPNLPWQPAVPDADDGVQHDRQP